MMPKYHLYNPTTDTHYTTSTYTGSRPTPNEQLIWSEGDAPESAIPYIGAPLNELEAALQAHQIILSLPVESRATHHLTITGVEAAIQRRDSELAQYLLSSIIPNNQDETDALSQIQTIFDSIPSN